MKRFSAYLVVLVLLGIIPVSYASMNANIENDLSSIGNEENPIVLMANAGLQVGLENQLEVSGMKVISNKDEPVSISVAGTIFALLLLTIGLFVGRKNKAKTNGIVGAFARNN